MIRHCLNLCNRSTFARLVKNETELIKCGSLPSSPIQFSVQSIRYKSKKHKKEISESESESYENNPQDEVEDKFTKILKINVTSLRVDAIMKSSLGMARNKIETLFYDNKIRLNGEKIQKKSASVQEGDEIDLIKGPDLKNPSFMNIARVEIMSIKGNEDSISVKVRRCKSLTVDIYT